VGISEGVCVGRTLGCGVEGNGLGCHVDGNGDGASDGRDEDGNGEGAPEGSAVVVPVAWATERANAKAARACNSDNVHKHK